MKRYLFIAIMACFLTSAFAYDFEVGGIYYNISSESNLTVEVTYKDFYKQYHTYKGPGSYEDDHCGYYCEYIGDIVIPKNVDYSGKTYTVTRIGNYAFATNTWGFRGSNTSNIYDALTNMNLKSIIIPETIIEIGAGAFQRCKALTIIDLPNSIISIGNNAFEGCTFKSLKIPSTVTSIGETPFPEELKELIMLPYLPPTGGAPFVHTNAEILVPSKRKYLSNAIWGSYSIIEILTPSQSEYVYNGINQIVEWTNNLKAYSMSTPIITLEKDAGNYSANVLVNFYRDNQLSFSVEFPYEYSIKKAVLNVKPGDANRVYGEENPSFILNYLGFVNGETDNEISTKPIVSTNATKESNVGDYPITISGGNAKNYELVYETGVLTVTKAPLSAKINDVTKIYGSQNPAFTIDYYGLKNDETAPTWTTNPTFQTEATQSSSVGKYEVTAINGVPVNYDLREITAGTLSITPAPLTIRANDATRQYYSDEPNLSYTCNGFVNGDNNNILSPEPTLATTANRSSNVGTYPIKISGASNSNYSISYVDGTLTITPRTLYAYVGNYERLYNEDNPAFEVKYDGFVSNEDENVLISKASASTTATKTSDVGSYPINVTGGSADNYKFSYTSGTLTINKAEQTISWEQDLSNLKVGDQVELQAIATSGLPITYSMESNNYAEIYSAGNNKKYLDCKAEGQFTIRATQDGNKNYYSSTRINKTVTIGNGESAVRSLSSNIIKIQKISLGIRIIDANIGDLIQIYSTDGILQKFVKAKKQITDIPLSKDKIYIVKIGGKTVTIGL